MSDFNLYALMALRGLTVALLLLGAWASPARPWRPGRLGWLLGQLTRTGYLTMALAYIYAISAGATSTVSPASLLLHLSTWLLCVAQIARRGAARNGVPL